MEIRTGAGLARAEVARPPAGDPSFLLVLTHGAGGEPASPDLLAAAGAGLRLGGVVARVTQPYRVKGGRAPGPVAAQDAAWVEIISALRTRLGPALPLVQGGRSNGARVACRTARAARADGVIALAFPLHPPGKPERSRAAELREAGTRVLVVNGDRDPFGVPAGTGAIQVVVLAGETHTLSRKPDEIGRAVESWLRKVISGGRLR